jgi:hypothetical protein
MIELILVVFKQLLLINHPSVHKKLLLMFEQESVLDAFVFISQDFSQWKAGDMSKKLALHFLEINCCIFSQVSPR